MGYGVGMTGGLLYPQAVDVQMQSMALRGPDGEPQPGLESQGRAASMPRLAAETQVGGLVGGEMCCAGGFHLACGLYCSGALPPRPTLQPGHSS